MQNIFHCTDKQRALSTALTHRLCVNALASAPISPASSKISFLTHVVELAYAATGIGLTISTLARSVVHAVMLVLLVLIPQILFSGHTVEVRNMSEQVRRMSELMPSFAAERIEDVSFFLNQKIAANEMAGFLIPYHNVNDVYRRLGYKVLESGKTIEETRPVWPLWLAFLTLIAWVTAGFLRLTSCSLQKRGSSPLWGHFAYLSDCTLVYSQIEM